MRQPDATPPCRVNNAVQVHNPLVSGTLGASVLMVPTCLRRHPVLLTATLLVVTWSGPSTAAAQRAASSSFEAGLTLGATPHLPSAFDPCHFLAGSFGGRLALRLASFWHVDVRTDIVGNVGAPPICFVCEACVCSFDRCVAPPPATGPYVLRDGRYDPPLSGSSFWISRLGSEWTVATHGSLGWRVGIGVGRIWGKHLWTPQLTSGFHWGSGLVRGILELSLWQYTVQRTDVESTYLDGQLVSQTLSREPIHETTVFLNLGFAIRGPRGH